MTAPDPQRAVAEARERLVMCAGAWLYREAFLINVDTFEAAVRASERARLLATQEDADAHAPGYYTEGRRDP